MSSESPWIGLTFDPLDTLFFRDGRPFEATNRVQSGWPTPQTLAGALRTALLTRTDFSFRSFRPPRVGPLDQALIDAGAQPWVVQSEFRGPFLALRDNKGIVEPLFPLPLVLSKAKDNPGWSRSNPLSERIEGWNDPDGLWPLYRRVQPDPKGDRPYLTLSGISKFLAGSDPASTDCVDPRELFGLDQRVGIAINPESLTTAKGQLYAIGLLALKPKLDGRRVCLYAEIKPGSEGNSSAASLVEKVEKEAIPFGGEGRHVKVTATQAVAWPKPAQPQSGSVWYLATPGFLPRRESGRLLPANSGLRATASGPGMAVSGWDVTRGGPRATRFAVPPGAVYFIDGTSTEADFLDQKLDDSINLKREGWGFALQGVWKKEGH